MSEGPVVTSFKSAISGQYASSPSLLKNCSHTKAVIVPAETALMMHEWSSGPPASNRPALFKARNTPA